MTASLTGSRRGSTPVNPIGPTFSDTPLVRPVVDAPEKRDFIMSRIPLGRLEMLGDIAARRMPAVCEGLDVSGLQVDSGRRSRYPLDERA